MSSHRVRVLFFVVWSFLLFELFGCFSFFCCLVGGVFFFFFGLFGRGPRPRPNSKKNNTPPPKQEKITRPRQNSKKNTPPPLPGVFFLAVWAGGCVCFLLFGPGSVFFFFAVWAGDVFFCFSSSSSVWAGGVFFLLFEPGGVFFFAVWAEACVCVCVCVFFFYCLGRGRVFFAVWAGDGSSLTYRSAWLIFKRPNNKKDQTERKKKRVPPPTEDEVEAHRENMHPSLERKSFKTLLCQHRATSSEDAREWHGRRIKHGRGGRSARPLQAKGGTQEMRKLSLTGQDCARKPGKH